MVLTTMQNSFPLTNLFMQNTNKTTVIILLHQSCDIFCMANHRIEPKLPNWDVRSTVSIFDK